MVEITPRATPQMSGGVLIISTYHPGLSMPQRAAHPRHKPTVRGCVRVWKLLTHGYCIINLQSHSSSADGAAAAYFVSADSIAAVTCEGDE